ncbi:MAG TPA: FAD-dependent oxidoreductase [Gammaproteobacteria bacterium]|nr:FAD-dependent oxidoreductase [Gammaproteobacteria bacterium]
MSVDIDLAVVGSGPAGLAAATQAAELGLDTVLFDEQATPGGQIYRNIEQVTAQRPQTLKLLSTDYYDGLVLIDAFRNSGVSYQAQTAVWEVVAERGDDGMISLGTVTGGTAEMYHAHAVIIATGAMERPVPLPGWTLPGVMGAGAVQTLLKGSAIIPDVSSVLIGSGPLLYLVAWQLLRAGAPPHALWLTTPRLQWRHALPALPGMLHAGDELWKGLRWLRELRAAGVSIRSGAEDLNIEGDDQVEAVSARFGGRRKRIKTRLALLHFGIIPNTQLTMASACKHVWDSVQRCWRPYHDDWGVTNVPGIFVAGDGAGIGGARAAKLCGQLATLEAARQLAHIDTRTRDALASPIQISLRRELGTRPFLNRLFPPPALNVSDELTVCPCEGVSAGELRKVIRLGCPGPNQAKAFIRCGMGPCQGRMCGLTVSESFARERGIPVETVGHYHLRPPVKPLTVGELAGLAGMPTPIVDSGGLPTKGHK